MHTPSRTSFHGRGGFTLPELLIVIVIIGLTARFAIPAFSTMMTGARLSGAANLVEQELSYTRMQAIRRGSKATFRTASASTYRITVESNGSIVRTVKSGSLSDFKSVTVSAPSDSVSFSSRGMLLAPAPTSATSYAKVTITRGTKTDSVLVYGNGRIQHVRT
jgi:prepilin-type N-terminal cleavage/methylation domain-containing protein